MTDSLCSFEARVEQFLRQIRRIEHRLRAAFAVAHIDEDDAAEIAAGVDPAGQSDCLPDVCRAQFVAMMCSFHSSVECEIQNEEFSFQESADSCL